MPRMLHSEIAEAVLFICLFLSSHPKICTPLNPYGLGKWIGYITESQKADTN